MSRKVKFVGIRNPEEDEEIIGRLPITEKTHIFVRVNEYKGKTRVDVRKWYWTTELNAWMPSKGINVEIGQMFQFTKLCKDVLNELIVKGYETGTEEFTKEVIKGFDNK